MRMCVHKYTDTHEYTCQELQEHVPPEHRLRALAVETLNVHSTGEKAEPKGRDLSTTAQLPRDQKPLPEAEKPVQPSGVCASEAPARPHIWE